MATSNNRFSISVLSRSNKAQAVNGELLMDKETGQLLVKTLTGDVISYDSTSRFNAFVNNAVTTAQLKGIRGSLQAVDFENFELPSVIANDTNFLTTKLTIKASNSKRFMLLFDFDTVEMSQNSLTTQLESNISLFFEFDNGGLLTNRVSVLTLTEVNNKVFNVVDFFPPNTDVSTYKISLTGIKIQKHGGYAANNKIKHIIHSMLAIIE